MNLYLSRLARLAAPAIITALISIPGNSPAMHASDGPDLTVVTNRTLTFSLRASLGMLQGEAHEIVYDYSRFGVRRKVSDLTWDLSNLCMAGVTASVRLGGRINVNAGYWTAINGGNGEMNDYDWMIPGADWTHWSRSDVEVLSGNMLDLNLSVDLLHVDAFTFSAIAGWKRDFWKWNDSAREYIYSVNSFRDTRGREDGSHMIDYQQLFEIPYIGAAAKCRLGSISANAYVVFGAGVSAEDKDWHIRRKIHFRETFSDGIYLGAGAWSQYYLSDHVFVTGSIDFELIPDIVGKLEATDDTTGATLVLEDGAGISHYSTMFSAAIGWQF